VLSATRPADVQAAWLPKIASGEALVVLAHQERKARYRLNHVRHQRCNAPPDMRLTATKSVVPAGDQADAFLVPAQLDGQDRPVPGRARAAGVTTRGYGTQDGAAPPRCSWPTPPPR
jgi:alkylation response protein AidB-like acyl-CoA dehydrogenase